MTAPQVDAPEFPDCPADFAGNDSIPATLEPLFTHIAAELFPELHDKLTFLDRWIERRRPREGAPVSEKQHQRRIGNVSSHVRLSTSVWIPISLMCFNVPIECCSS